MEVPIVATVTVSFIASLVGKQICSFVFFKLSTKAVRPKLIGCFELWVVVVVESRFEPVEVCVYTFYLIVSCSQ